MIYVNDEKQDLSPASKTPVAKEYHAALEYFNTLGWPVKFKVKPSILGRNEDENGKVYMVMPTYYIHHTALINTAYGTEMWRFTPTAPYKKDGVLHYPQEGKSAAYNRKRLSFEKDQADLLFFLWYKSKFFKQIYDIDDAKAEAANKVKAEMDSIKLKATFFGEDSVLQNDREKLTTICRAYNVPRSDTMTHEQRILSLEGVITDLIEKRKLTVDEFLESLDLDLLTELSAKIQEAEDNKLIVYDEKQYSWFFVGEGGTIGDKIVQVPISKKESKHQYLRDNLKSNQTLLDKFNKHIDSKPNDVFNIDINNLEDLDWMTEVLPYINAVGIKPPGVNRKKKDVFDEIRRTHA